MGDELWGLAKWIMGGFITVGVAVGGWLWRQAISDIRDLEDDMSAARLNLSEFKLHVAETHPTKTDLVSTEAKMRETLSRLHDRIDVVSEDIKTIIGLVGNGKK